MNIPARFDLAGQRYYDFSHMFEFDYDISSMSFYSEVRQGGELKATFQIITSLDSITLMLSETAMTALPAGTYDYDVKQKASTGFEKQIIVGKFIVNNGVTQAP